MARRLRFQIPLIKLGTELFGIKHVEKKSACIYSQLKSCSSSEVAAMIERVLRHCTEMVVGYIQ